MAVEEIDKFVLKFKSLWKSGLTAHLDLDAHAGEAWVGLRLRVGGVSASYTFYPSRSRTSPSREQRREKRATARNGQNDDQTLHEAQEEREECDVNVTTEEVYVQIDNIIQEVKDEKCVDEYSETEEVAAQIEKESVSLETEKLTNDLGMVIDETCDENKEIVNNISEEILVVTEDSLEVGSTEVHRNEVKSVSETEEKQPEVIIVHTTAVIDNSPGEILTKADGKNLQDLIFRERHLQQNILNLEFGRQESRNLTNGKFKHTLEIKLFVSTKNIWEGPRSYIWKHLGQNERKKGNGASAVFNRIHVKT